MTYFLDFDRTLLDTDTLIEKLSARPELASSADYLAMKGPPGPERNQAFINLMNADKISFAPGEVTPLLYPDVFEFLSAHQCVIVTYGHLQWQKIKVESAFSGSPLAPVVYTEYEMKGTVIARTQDSYQAPHFFIDDDVQQLDSVREACPEITCYEIRRDGKSGSGKYPVIANLNQLPQ